MFNRENLQIIIELYKISLENYKSAPSLYANFVVCFNSFNTTIMKKLFLALLFFAGTAMALAQAEKQDDRQEVDQDKIQQEPQRTSQLQLERAARIEAQRLENERVAKKAVKRAARKAAKEKAKQAAVLQEPLQ